MRAIECTGRRRAALSEKQAWVVAIKTQGVSVVSFLLCLFLGLIRTVNSDSMGGAVTLLGRNRGGLR